MKTKLNLKLNTRTLLKVTVLLLALITISTTTASALSCDCDGICVDETGWWRDGGVFNASTTPIQAAVDNATTGETICVKAGSYTENVDITTSHLTLAGAGAGVVTVTAANPDDHVFEVTADYVSISGFTATGAIKGYPCAGFYLNSIDHCNISENVASGNYDGIRLKSSSSNTLTSNTADSNNNNGICLSASSGNTLTSNTVDSNGDRSIFLLAVRTATRSQATPLTWATSAFACLIRAATRSRTTPLTRTMKASTCNIHTPTRSRATPHRTTTTASGCIDRATTSSTTTTSTTSGTTLKMTGAISGTSRGP